MKTKTFLTVLAVVVSLAGRAQAVDIEFHTDGIIDNGDVYDVVSVYDTPPDFTTVDMLGGSIQSFQTYDSSVVNVYGGEVLWGLLSFSASTVNLYAGTINCESLALNDSSTLNAYGGALVVGNSPYFSSSSAVNIYGYGFNYDGFELTGFLLDDSPFSIRELSQWEYEHINLIPEPGSVILLAAGSLLMRLRRK